MGLTAVHGEDCRPVVVALYTRECLVNGIQCMAGRFFGIIISYMHTTTESPGGVSDHRIEVTVLTGFLGSGKTTLLNRLVRHPSYADAAVIINEWGEIGVDHHLLRYAEGHIALIEGGCICCAVGGDMVNALRDLFMSALRRQIPRFRRVLIETTGLATPSRVLFTLRHDPFLAERYVHRGTITVVDAKHIQSQLFAQPEAADQLAAADVVVCSKTDLLDLEHLDVGIESIKQINPGVPIVMQRPDSVLDERIWECSRVSGRADHGALSRWLGGSLSLGKSQHPEVRHAVVDLPLPVSRAAFLTGMAQLQEAHHVGILRIKGLIKFLGEDLPCAVHGVHRDLYPLEPIVSRSVGECRSWLVLILRGLDLERVVAELRQALGQPDV